MKRFHIRTIKNGQVKILGHYYHPDNTHMQYDGRLDGMRYAFGLYRIGDEDDKLEPFVCLWGTEKAYRSECHTDWYGPECIDGHFYWYWWHE